MDKPLNKKIYRGAVTAVAAEITIAVSLLFVPSLSLFTKLRIFGGFFIIIKACYFLFYFETNHYLKEEKLLRYSFILFPVMTSIFAGIAVLVWGVPSLSRVFNLCGAGLTLSFLISMILRRHFLKAKKLKAS